MPWSSYWITPWMFFGPMMTLLLMTICMVGMFLAMRAGPVRHSSPEIGPIGPVFGSARSPADRPTPFEERRDERLPRFDQEQSEVQEFIGHPCAKKDKVESDQFLAERRSRPLPRG
jgi:hypothetical protein